MALLFMDSFDHYIDLDEKWDAQFFGRNILGTQLYGRFTPGALEIVGAGGGGYRDKNLPNSSELIAGFAWINEAGDDDDGIFSFLDDFSTKANLPTLIINTNTGVATFTYNGNSASTSAGLFTGSVWQHVEMRLVMSDTVGVMEIRRNGILVASLTGIDTKPSGVTSLTGFRVEADSNFQFHLIDDLYILDGTGSDNNSYLGDTRITVLRPKADGLVNNFVAVGAASNFEAVDEHLHDGDTTYVEAGVVGARESYDNKSFSEVGISPGDIFGVQAVNAVVKTDAGGINYLDNMVVAGVVYDNGVDVIATSGLYKMTTFARDTDPSDDAGWTEAKVASVGSGLEITFREE